jgi:PAS domain S-box-containing protein
MTSLIQSGEATTDVRLENESALLRALVRSIPDLVWLKNSEGIYLACNPEFERFFGAPETEIVGKTDYDFVDVKLADFFCQKDREAMAADRPSTNEEWITYASDGHRALLETIKTPMRDSSGKLIGVLGIARDITERRRLEEALREGEHKFRSLFEMANDGIFVMETTRFTFMDCNERGAAMYGLSREQVIGRSPAELTPERQPDGRLSADVVVEKVQAALAGQPQIFDWQPLRADGTPFDVEITLNRIDLAGQPYLQSIVRDISERKESERQFQREHAFRQQLIDSIPGAFYLFDRSGRFQMWNRNFETVLGFTAKEIENSHPLDFFSPEDRPRVEHAIQKTFETGASQVEAFFQAKDGTSTPYYFNGLRFKLETGEYGLIGVGIDITQRREAEAALRASEEKLRGLYDLSPLGIALTDMNGRYIEFNEAFCRICGYPLEELNSLDYWALTPKKYEAQERQQLDSLARTGRYGPYEKEYRRKDGSLIPLRFNGMLLVGSDGQQYIWSIVEDITQQKAAEGTIHNLNADLTATLQAVPDLLFDLDRDGTYLGIWAQKSALLISQREALLGHTVTEMLPPDAAEVVMGAIAEADERGHSYDKAIRLDIAEGERWFE